VAAAFVPLIAQLIPLIGDAVVHIKQIHNSDGTSAVSLLITDPKTQNDINAQNIQTFLNSLATKPEPKT